MASNHPTPIWELSKENAAPLQRGRNIEILERSLAETDETRASKERKVDRYEASVRRSERDDFNVSESDSATEDPLVHWLSYIKFHQEAFPSNTHDQFLLMERCFRALSRFRRYANDVRFIRLCCQYAEKTERPNEIFQYLYQQKIGCETAIFWIAWGFVAEKREEWAFANDIYSKGIRKRAKPVEKLNKRYREFQRRMARHWLNATQTQDDDENTTANRGILGSLSEDAVHRNDRSTSQPPGPSFLGRTSQSHAPRNQNTFSERSNSSRSGDRTASTNHSSSAAFPIFIEDGSSSGNPLDNSLVQEDVPYRQLEREQDRKKENTHAAERWNDRGAYAPTYKKAVPATRQRKGNPPPFAVFVDEECAEQHRREESQQTREFEAHRKVRDERTFRERDDLACVGDALFKDPLRYVRDPSQLTLDQQSQQQTTASKNRPDNNRKANAGFSTRLLRHPDTGEEQCFEEARALAKYYKLAPPSSNVFNLVIPSHSDSMSMDEESDEEINMPQAEERSKSNVPRQPFGQRRKSLCIPQDQSVDQPTPRNASTASSTVDDLAAGTLARADPTINTQLALKELSMMFSSPAMELNDSASVILDRSGGLGPILNQSGVSEPAEDRSMVAIDEDKVLDEESFSEGPRQTTFSIYDDSEEKSTLKKQPIPFQIFDETGAKEDSNQACGNQKNSFEQNSKQPTFAVYCDENTSSDQQSKPAFGIYDESQAEASLDKETKFSVYDEFEDDDRKGMARPTSKANFEIYEEAKDLSGEGNELCSCNIDHEKKNSDSTDKSKTPGLTIYEHESDDGDTDSIPSVGDLFDDLVPREETTDSLVSHVNAENLKRCRSDTLTQEAEFTECFGDISCIMPSDDNTATLCTNLLGNIERAVDYEVRHRQDVKLAIQRLSTRSVPFPKNRKSLAKILSTENLVCNLPSHVIPAALRLQKSAVASGTCITLVRSTASVKQELGRGAYGCVLLLESETNSSDTKTAVKAQAPIGCLAWEYEILERLRARLSDKLTPRERAPFPRPLSFVSLADGALLTMEAVSPSGLNFIDLINVHRQCRGEPALPEILALHYVCRMLDALQKLHWLGHILHCDTKADNWVLSSSDLLNDEIEASDVMLTDFGRAIDLEALETIGESCLDNRMKGKATREDMMCVAMKRGFPWSFDIDTYGLCDTAHLLLFGSSLELVRDSKTGRWCPRQKPKRYHQRDLWLRLFDSLLNLEEPDQAAIGSHPGSLRQIRGDFDKYLQERQAEVRAQLVHQATFLPSKRPVSSPR